MLTPHQPPIIQQIEEPFLEEKGVILFIKREDLIHLAISGNKWRKLKYNLIEAQSSGYSKILTFGGAYSSHIYATAAAAKEAGLKSIGVIRGEETLPLNDTLQFAIDQCMQLHYTRRELYRQKKESWFIEKLKDKFGDFYFVPEGGSNQLAVKGCAEIADDIDFKYDVICSPVGTGGTLAGLITSHRSDTKVIGFSALKGQDFLEEEVSNLLIDLPQSPNWKIDYNYHFGGYAKIKSELVSFINSFYDRHQIILDPIYTGKMMFGIYDLIQKGRFDMGCKIVAIHTGGLQGIDGIMKRYGVTLPR